MTNACSNAKRNISCPKIIQTYIPHGIVSYLKSMPQSSLETIQHIQRVNQSNVSPIRLALMIPSNLFSFFSVTASPKMFDADVLKAQLEPTWFCGCKIPGRFTWIMAPKSSEKLWVHPLVCVWCFLAPFKSLRWGPISSPLPPPHIIRIYKETHISNIVQLQNQAQLQICKHLQTSCCSLFFPDISLQPSSNHRNFQLSNWKGSNLYVKNINP